MANPLTGDFDVVAQLSPTAINRLLAAQHQLSGDDQLYFHSVRIAVPAGRDHGVHGTVDVQVSTPTVSFPTGGPPVVLAVAAPAAAATSIPTLLAPDPLPVAALIPGSALRPPASGGDSRVTIHYQVMARWNPGPGSVVAPEFVHGEVQATVDVEQIISTSANVISVDLGASDVHVTFLPDNGSPASVANAGLINEVVRDLVRTSFEPVNLVIELPSDAGTFAPHHWRFKTQPDDDPPAVALLLNMRSDRVPVEAHRDAFDTKFLGGGDDFAIAVGSSFLIPILRDLISEQIESQVVGVSKKIGLLFGSVTYEIASAREPEVVLAPGAITLAVAVSAEGSGRAPDFDVTISQAFTLQAVNGTVRLERVGDVGVAIKADDVIGKVILFFFKRGVKGRIGDAADAAIDSILTSAAPLLEDVLSGLDALLDEGRLPPVDVDYGAVDISPDGIIVRGEMTMAEWEEVVVSFRSRVLPGSQLELNAFESWIPGGTVERFRWRFGDGNTVEQLINHEHQFVARPPQPGSPGQVQSLWSQWCLEVSGTRNGSPVTGSNCHLVGPPVVLGTDNEAGGGDDDESPLPVAVRSEAGRLVAHVDLSGPPRGLSGRQSGVWPATVLVHFAGSDQGSTPALLREALALNEMTGEILVVSVVDPGRLEDAAVNEDLPGAHVVWAEDFEGTWAGRFGDGYDNAAYLVNSREGVVWRSDGRPDAQELSDALAHFAMTAELPPPRRIRTAVSPGEPAPDFLFEYGAGTTMALRTLRRRPVLLNFFKSWSIPCHVELKRLAAIHDASSRGLRILAVSDGEDGETAQAMVEELGLGFRVLADSQRHIANLYGIRAWPTTITIDERGLVRQISTGVEAESEVDSAYTR